MPITVAKTAGFCFGVNRAVNMVCEAVQALPRVCTLGPIINNPQMTGKLEKMGVRILSSSEEAQQGDTVVLRSHGVGEDIYRDLENRGISYLDATCPFVAKIHQIVSLCKGEQVILLAGDASHPEVEGILGHCKVPAYVFQNQAELLNLLRENEQIVKKECILLAQTTFHTAEWKKCVETTKKECTNLSIFDTICSATSRRQQEACDLAQNSDFMVVVGGKSSSNTARLREICASYCETVLIETAEELKDIPFQNYRKIGVTAGASTPACIIKEVQETMSEEIMMNQEESFEEMLNNSTITTYNGAIVKGVVIGMNPTEIQVDIGTKYTGYVPLHELTDDPSAKAEELVKIGDELDLLVVRVNDVEGTVVLSKKRLDAAAGIKKVMDAKDTQETLSGVVVEVVNKGVLALTNGVKVFIPASQCSNSRIEDLSVLLKQPVEFKIIETNPARKRAVGSVRAVLREQRKALEDQFWSTVEVGKIYTGVVKSLTDYAAFVDLGGVDGMVHKTELSWKRIKHPSEVVKVGDTIEVYVRDIDPEAKKISLGYKKSEDNPWEILKREYEVGQVVKAKIVSMTTFGAFAQIIPGADGLIHISQISADRIAKPQDVLSIGQEVEAQITELDFDRKRISLSMKALLENADSSEETSAEENAAE